MLDIKRTKALPPEYNTTHQTVSETLGQILSYQSGIVESIYGATQAIAREAHKGVGMTQTEAYSYAAQGYNYNANFGDLLSWYEGCKTGGGAVVSLQLFLRLNYRYPPAVLLEVASITPSGVVPFSIHNHLKNR